MGCHGHGCFRLVPPVNAPATLFTLVCFACQMPAHSNACALHTHLSTSLSHLRDVRCACWVRVSPQRMKKTALQQRSLRCGPIKPATGSRWPRQQQVPVTLSASEADAGLHTDNGLTIHTNRTQQHAVAELQRIWQFHTTHPVA